MFLTFGIAASGRRLKFRKTSSPRKLPHSESYRGLANMGKTGPKPIPFDLRIEKMENGCNEWVGYRNWAGYGKLSYDGKLSFAHRIAWERANGSPIPKGMLVCHKCDNPPCCNPDHLFLGTFKDNSMDAAAKGRFSKREIRYKFSAQVVCEIKRISDGGHTRKEIMAMFSIGHSQLYRILSGRCGR